MNGTKRAKLDKQKFDLPIDEKGRRQLRGLTFQVTLPDFQEAALEYAHAVIAGITDSFAQSALAVKLLSENIGTSFVRFPPSQTNYYDNPGTQPTQPLAGSHRLA